MSDESSRIPDSLRAKFPDLRPIKRAPVLQRVNGIGMGMYGKRDWDGETRSYVKTYCFCIVLIPVLAVGAYRVVDGERGGWYFLGKERLSSFAKSCNFGVLCLSLLFAGIVAERSYKSSPDYLARKELKSAAQNLESGNAFEAAQLYRNVAIGPALVEEARQGLRTSLERCLTNPAPSKVISAFRLYAALPPQLNSPTPLILNAYDRGAQLVEQFRASDADSALELLRVVAPLGGTNAPLRQIEPDLLKQIVAAHPDNTNRIVELALIYEAQKKMDDCYELLLPHRQHLGSTEGARILGQHLLEESKYEDAYGLLYPYVQARLEKLRAVERNYTNTLETLYQRAIDELNDRKGDPGFYDAYEKASKAEKRVLVEKYAQKRIQSDPSFKRAIAELESAGTVVHVTLDLGMVQLNRAQNLPDPAARKAELEAAEKTFLSIRGLAGDSEEYQLFLGQVDYWLGKSREGKELFDALLEKSHRSFAMLMELSQTLRNVGDLAQARVMLEEAYAKAKSDKQKYAAASFRAHVEKDINDHIAWLEKSDPNEPSVQTALNSAHGQKALQEGNRKDAAAYLRAASAAYSGLPASATTLNNWGLVCLNLYEATGDIKDHDRGLELLEQAVALEPGDSILLMNTMHILFARAVMDVVRDSIRVEQLGESAETSLLRHLYIEEQAQQALYGQLRDNEHMKKALAYLEKGLLLAPKNPGLYRAALHYYLGFRETDELKKVAQQFKVAEIDFAEARKEAQEAYSGAKDKELLGEVKARIRTLEPLLNTPAVKENPLTLECVEVELNGMQQTEACYTNDVDSQRLLDNALASYQRHASEATVSALIAANWLRASDELSKQNPDFAALRDRTRRVLSPHELMTWILERGGPLAEVVAKNTNVQKALSLKRTGLQRFPSLPNVENWALFENVAPAEAGRLAANFKTNELARVAVQLEYQFQPATASAVLARYWYLKMTGEQSQANDVYAQGIRDGIPLPTF